MTTYENFLKSKAVIALNRGMEPGEMNPNLKPHARDIAAWAIRGGNRAIFANFGLHKTSIQLQILDSILRKHAGPGLIICPLGMKHEFVREAKNRKFDFSPVYVRTNEELEELQAAGHRYFLTNYERVRDGALDPNRFVVCSLDEASVLRSFGSKTYQTFLTLFEQVPFKYVATATPDPNRHKELIHYAGFLGIMDTGQALTRFFKRDSSQAGNLQLHPHKAEEFWLWVSTWACFIERPSDLGHSDDGYILPKLNVHRHRLPVDHSTAGFDSWGQGKLLRDASLNLRETAREKRDSLADRIQCAVAIVDAAPKGTHWIIWHDLEDERRAIEAAFPECATVFGTLAPVRRWGNSDARNQADHRRVRFQLSAPQEMKSDSLSRCLRRILSKRGVERLQAPTFGSLFTGIGGIDLGLERAGWECRFQVEFEPFCNQILEKHWPGVKRYGDIRTIRGDELEPVDMLAGGYPCQPFSQAGKRGGESDPRHLWPEFARLIRVLRPRFVLLENVPGHLSLGFGAVLGDLARLGYDAEWLCLRASDFGAAHLRKRVFVVAYRTGSRPTWAEDVGTDRSTKAEGSRSLEPQRIGDPGGALAESSQRGFRILRESPERIGLAYGGYPALENARRAELGRPAQSTELRRSGSPVHDCGAGGTLAHPARDVRNGSHGQDGARRGVCEAGEPMADAARAQAPRFRQQREHLSGTPSEFAPGPSESRWQAILAERPDLAPSLPHAVRKHGNNAGYGASADGGELATSTEVLGSGKAPAESPLRGVADGVPDWLDRAMSERTKRLRALGNAVVPQVAEYIGRAILRDLKPSTP